MIDWAVLGAVGHRVRTNHALEHATITILSGRFSHVTLRGRSNRHGFYVMGEVPRDEVSSAASDALQRLNAGQSELAVHPFCGTNLAVSGTLAGLASAIAARANRRDGAYPMAILAGLLAVLVAQPLGIWTQRHLTTQSDVRGLRIVDVETKRFLGKKLHFVHTTF